MFDVTFARSHFPALAGDWTLLDNAGGSVAPRQVIDRVRAYMEGFGVQLGASYPRSVEAAERVAQGQRAAAQLIHADPGEVVLGGSTTSNVALLAAALLPSWRPGDEVVVTNLDHESNIGPWRRLASAGITIREWPFDLETATLRMAELEPLLNERTRLVCFTHCANVVGAIHDVAAITRRVHQAGALVCVDGVALAPHRRVDVKALDVDFYLLSLYKTFGPHLGLLYGKRSHLLAARGQSHFFVGEDELPYKLQPGGVNHELTAALPGILEYLEALAIRGGCAPGQEPAAWLGPVFDAITAHEQTLAERLLRFLAERPGVRVIGPTVADEQRAPTIAFTVDGRPASAIPPLLEKHRLAVRFGHFYAHRAIRALGLLEGDGVVRVSMAHYNTADEVDRLIEALHAVL